MFNFFLSSVIFVAEVVNFVVGDLAWAKIGSFPYWPCLVSEEPKTGQYKKNG